MQVIIDLAFKSRRILTMLRPTTAMISERNGMDQFTAVIILDYDLHNICIYIYIYNFLNSRIIRYGIN